LVSVYRIRQLICELAFVVSNNKSIKKSKVPWYSGTGGLKLVERARARTIDS
jgi:hypothetical protein